MEEQQCILQHVVGEPCTFCGPARSETPAAPTGGTAAVATASTSAGQPSTGPLNEAERNALIQDLGYAPAHTSVSKKTTPSASTSSGGAAEVKKSIQKRKELTRRHSFGDQARRDPTSVEGQDLAGAPTTQKARE